MFYFIRKIVFNGDIGIEYIKNPTKILELGLTRVEQKHLQDYLTVSQQIRYKMLTEFDENTVIPAKFFSNNVNLKQSFSCFGFNNIYDYLERIYYSDLNSCLEKNLKISAEILNWTVSDLKVLESVPIELDYSSVELLWLNSYPVRPVIPEDSLVMKL